MCQPLNPLAINHLTNTVVLVEGDCSVLTDEENTVWPVLQKRCINHELLKGHSILDPEGDGMETHNENVAGGGGVK